MTYDSNTYKLLAKIFYTNHLNNHSNKNQTERFTFSSMIRFLLSFNRFMDVLWIDKREEYSLVTLTIASSFYTFIWFLIVNTIEFSDSFSLFRSFSFSRIRSIIEVYRFKLFDVLYITEMIPEKRLELFWWFETKHYNNILRSVW